MFFGDYHTHTVFSHGKGTILQNVQRAADLGLKEIAITDHGLSHIAFGLNEDKVIRMRAEIDRIQPLFPDTRILLGVEANLVGLNGTIDVIDDEWEMFDIVLMGYHKFVWPSMVWDYFKLFAANYLYDTLKTRAPDKLMVRNTDACVEAVMNNNIDVFTHVNYGFPVDCKEVAAACKEYGTFLEINGKRISYTDAEFEEMAATGVQFIMNSDAHSVGRIMDVEPGLALLRRTGYPLEAVVNYNRRPEFRLEKFREQMKKTGAAKEAP